MAHTVHLTDPRGYLDRDTIQDFIDLFFDALDSTFYIEVIPPCGKVPNNSIRGLCATNGKQQFRIKLYAGNIQEQMDRGITMGGNVTKAQNLKHGLYLVLTHELRHAHQAIYFGSNSTLHKGRYRGRAGEVDARRHVDESYDAVCAFLGYDPERVQASIENPVLNVYIDMLADSARGNIVEVTDDEIWDQVMSMPGDPDVLHRKVLDGLTARGLRLG